MTTHGYTMAFVSGLDSVSDKLTAVQPWLFFVSVIGLRS